jgi:hypothetical protein
MSKAGNERNEKSESGWKQKTYKEGRVNSNASVEASEPSDFSILIAR